MDERFVSCTILKDYIGEMQTDINDNYSRLNIIDGERVYRISCDKKITSLPENAIPFATDGDKRNILGFRKKLGKGEIVFFGGTWVTADFVQVKTFENMLSWLDAKPCVNSTNRCVFSTLFKDGKKLALFLLNLYTGKQKTNVTVYNGEQAIDIGEVELSPMDVKLITFDLDK
jgi:hypothetical protein